MAVAELLGKMAAEIEEEMSLDEFSDWRAWMKFKREVQEKDNRRMKSKVKGRRK